MTAIGTVCRPGEGRTFSIGADLVAVMGVSDTDAFSVVDYVAAPGVPGPPPHVHHANEEGFFILEGEVEFLLGDTKTVLGPGSFVHVPIGAVHTFTNVGAGQARWVGIFAPGRYLRWSRSWERSSPPTGRPTSPPSPRCWPAGRPTRSAARNAATPRRGWSGPVNSPAPATVPA